MPSKQFTHNYRFDPTYGMDLAQLLAIAPPAEPDDFAAFWQDRYAAALRQDQRPQIRPGDQLIGNHTVSELRYCSTDGVEIGGWLLLPRDEPVRRGAIIGHGYGGRTGPDLLVGMDDAAVLFPCFRGMSQSPVAGLSPEPYQHVLQGIEDRDRYVLGGCVDDLWLGVSALLSLYPELTGQVVCMGISFAGGIGALAAPWDARIGRLVAQLPTFGHQALRLTLPSVGSCEAVRAYQLQHEFNVMATLAYYDAASAARHLRIPTLVAAALFDPAVPPPGQFAIHNAIPASLRRLIVLDAGHFDYPGKAGQQQKLDQEVIRFLS
jgi:cephalosporin-C deacetylase